MYLNEIDQIIFQLESVLKYIHNIGIAHLDLKLENILIHHNENEIKIKVIDFGNAKVFKKFKFDNKNEFDIIYSKGLCGTLEYSSPEQFTKTFYSPDKADFWALGIIVFEMFFFKVPWNRAKLSDNDFYKYNENQNLFFNKNLPAKYKHLLMNLLNLNWESRTN